MLSFSGVGGYLLLIFPMFLYLRNVSSELLLGGTMLTGLLAEMVYGYLAGSLLFGLGVAVLVLESVRTIIQWKWLAVRIAGFFIFVFVVFSSRALFIYLIFRSLALPAWLPLLITVLIGTLFIVISFLTDMLSLTGKGR